MITAGERETDCYHLRNKTYFVICPECGQEITFYGFSVTFCTDINACGAKLEADARALMLNVPERINYHFGKGKKYGNN